MWLFAVFIDIVQSPQIFETQPIHQLRLCARLQDSAPTSPHRGKIKLKRILLIPLPLPGNGLLFFKVNLPMHFCCCIYFPFPEVHCWHYSLNFFFLKNGRQIYCLFQFSIDSQTLIFSIYLPIALIICLYLQQYLLQLRLEYYVIDYCFQHSILTLQPIPGRYSCKTFQDVPGVDNGKKKKNLSLVFLCPLVGNYKQRGTCVRINLTNNFVWRCGSQKTCFV